MALFGRRLALSGDPSAHPAAMARFEADAPPVAQDGRREFSFDDVLKLIPGEVVAPFIAGSGLPLTDIAGLPWRFVVFGACLLACVVLRGQASKPEDAPWGLKGVNWPLVGVSAFAFFLWAHAVNERGPIIGRSVFGGLPDGMSPTAIWGFFAVIFGLIAPRLVPKTKAGA